MLRFMQKHSRKVGLPPGEAIHIGEACPWSPQFQIIHYDETNLEKSNTAEVADIQRFKDRPTVSWIDLSGIHRVELIQKLSEIFNWHALVVEDIVNSDHPPKIESYTDYIFLVAKILRFNESTRRIEKEQISLICGSNYVVSFRQTKDAFLEPILKRLQMSKGRIRRMNADYLAYAILDLIVDHYFVVLEKIGFAIEEVEEELIQSATHTTLNTIHCLNREILLFRKTVMPMREISTRLIQDENDLIHEKTIPFLRDLHDHIIQIIETGETFREVITNMLNLYMSQVSNRMNEIMKVLTMFAALFIPLTFIAGIYGMNFEYMPELSQPYSYPILLGFMVFVATGMWVYFRRKGWI